MEEDTQVVEETTPEVEAPVEAPVETPAEQVLVFFSRDIRQFNMLNLLQVRERGDRIVNLSCHKHLCLL